ncbi:hypothetical protein [Gemmobacter sp. 24YEA27]|uniref:hypothetical protein n=1 Tax=Gemmobacter sp. 24YEA27 TaxID=3040672 RepID=UPI0024B38FE4|nr:hypothetical protein [Gemmobacter sp. 24YEA27]
MRIALVAAPDWQPAPWQARIIDRISRDPLLQLVALIPGVPRGLPDPALALRGCS